MATRTSSVAPVDLDPETLAALEARLGALRARYPSAILDRYLSLLPSFGAKVFVAKGAAIVGDVRLGEDASVWYNAVCRGDIAPVTIGARSNIQDGSVLHVGDDSPCVVGNDVVVGHRVMLHGCTVEDACLIGMQATLLDDCVIGTGSIVGAGALVTQRTVVPPFSLVLGAPAKVIRTLPETTARDNRALAAKYVRLKDNY
jgi:carbonic anhydrase/acetyltransferase-like protein (isoleucine patch superfamily)